MSKKFFVYTALCSSSFEGRRGDVYVYFNNVFCSLILRSFFAYPSLILRSERLVPILFLYRLYIY